MRNLYEALRSEKFFWLASPDLRRCLVEAAGTQDCIYDPELAEKDPEYRGYDQAEETVNAFESFTPMQRAEAIEKFESHPDIHDTLEKYYYWLSFLNPPQPYFDFKVVEDYDDEIPF